MVIELDFKVTQTSRLGLRKEVVSKFLEELPGRGGGELASKYRYNVETLQDGRVVYLTRPAVLKKGFDFRINVTGTVFGNGKEYPRHNDIFDDLRLKKKNAPKQCARLHAAIQRVFQCEDPDSFLAEYSDLQFRHGHPVELILKVTKWFFIEQDIRDWNYSGREMFKKAVDAILEQ